MHRESLPHTLRRLMSSREHRQIMLGCQLVATSASAELKAAQSGGTLHQSRVTHRRPSTRSLASMCPRLLSYPYPADLARRFPSLPSLRTSRYRRSTIRRALAGRPRSIRSCRPEPMQRSSSPSTRPTSPSLPSPSSTHSHFSSPTTPVNSTEPSTFDLRPRCREGGSDTVDSLQPLYRCGGRCTRRSRRCCLS